MISKSPAQAGDFHLSKNFYSLRVFFDKCFHSSPKLSALLAAMRIATPVLRHWFAMTSFFGSLHRQSRGLDIFLIL